MSDLKLEQAKERLAEDCVCVGLDREQHDEDIRSVLDALAEAQAENEALDRNADQWRDRYTAVSDAIGDREGETWRSTHDLPERVAAMRAALAGAQADLTAVCQDRERLIAKLAEAESIIADKVAALEYMGEKLEDAEAEPGGEAVSDYARFAAKSEVHAALLNAEGRILDLEETLAEARAEIASDNLTIAADRNKLGLLTEALKRYGGIPDGVDGSWTADNALAAAQSSPEPAPLEGAMDVCEHGRYWQEYCSRCNRPSPEPEVKRAEVFDPTDTGRFSRMCSSCGSESELPLPRTRCCDPMTGEIEMVAFCEACQPSPVKPEEPSR